MKRFIIAALLAASTFLIAPPSHAGFFSFFGTLSGPAEAPPNASPGTGSTLVTLDTNTHLLTVSASFSGLLGLTSASHIHCCTAVPGVSTVGIATVTPSFPGFPPGVTAGSFSSTFDTSLAANTVVPVGTPGSAWTTNFITANGGTPLTADSAFLGGLLGGRAYLNIHTGPNALTGNPGVPGGEIRTFLAAPEPASIALLTVGLLGLGAARKRIRR